MNSSLRSYSNVILSTVLSGEFILLASILFDLVENDIEYLTYMFVTLFVTEFLMLYAFHTFGYDKATGKAHFSIGGMVASFILMLFIPVFILFDANSNPMSLFTGTGFALEEFLAAYCFFAVLLFLSMTVQMKRHLTQWSDSFLHILVVVFSSIGFTTLAFTNPGETTMVLFLGYLIVMRLVLGFLQPKITSIFTREPATGRERGRLFFQVTGITLLICFGYIPYFFAVYLMQLLLF